jgi:hypothetical protein
VRTPHGQHHGGHRGRGVTVLTYPFPTRTTYPFVGTVDHGVFDQDVDSTATTYLDITRNNRQSNVVCAVHAADGELILQTDRP